MKRFLMLLLVMTATLSLCACGDKTDGTKETTSVSAYKSSGNYTTVNDQLTWEKINSFPVVSNDTTIEEGRKMVVDFFRFAKTALWVPADTYEYEISEKHPGTLYIEKNTIYGGLPYIGLATGNIYRLMDYMDESTGVVDIASAGEVPRLFGNQCSCASYWGWSRVLNSATFSWTDYIMEHDGYYRVGDYAYDDSIPKWSADYGTDEVCAENGKDTMFASYAQLQPGDGIVNYATGGHVIMISDVHVEKDAAGKVDPEKSYVLYIDQTFQHDSATNEAGDFYNFENSVDAKRSFSLLYSSDYIPFTYAEWMGTDPIEAMEISCNHSGDTITRANLATTTVTCNYGLSDIYISVYDKDGNEVYKHAVRTLVPGVKEIDFLFSGKAVKTWGNWNDLEKNGDYTLKLYAQCSTGQRPTIWEGKLIAE